jgi:hypothetical protein
MDKALAELAKDGNLAAAVPFFSPADIDALIKHCTRLPMRKASARVGAEGREVTQDFDICFPAPRKDVLAQLADLLEKTVSVVNNKAMPPYMDEPFMLNDIAVQHYHPRSKGISPHLDALRYRGLVFIITLAGESRLAQCQDRKRNGAVRIDDKPGQLVVLSAPGFCRRKDEAARPLHFVDDITRGRLSIGLRNDTKI